MDIVIKNACINNHIQDLLIQGNSIEKIGKDLPVHQVDKVIDGKNKALVPGFFNGHTHAAMTLMRGYADDMPLMPWLEEKIWPLESKITEEDVYWGAKLACLEMIKTGTTTLVDMYHHFPATLKAMDEMGIRAMLTFAGFDFNQPHLAEKYKKSVAKHMRLMDKVSDRIQLALGPHAIYTVSTDLLLWVKQFASANNLRIQTHLSETAGEVENALKKFGKRPVQYLNDLGFLDENVSLAHCVHLDDTDIKILADTGAQVIHNPASNMKLASGNNFRFRDLTEAGVCVGIGTDGCSSGNNLDMLEAMKLASLNGKAAWQDPTLWTSEQTFKVGTESNEQVTGFKVGKIEEGYLADLLLIKLDTPSMTPNFNLISNLIYSANGDVVDSVICDGKILMEDRKVPGEEEIIIQAGNVALDLAKR